jgi:hypothetical protein
MVTQIVVTVEGCDAETYTDVAAGEWRWAIMNAMRLRLKWDVQFVRA